MSSRELAMGRSPPAQAGKLLCEGEVCPQQHLPVVLRDLTMGRVTANAVPTQPACPGEYDREMEAYRQQGMG